MLLGLGDPCFCAITYPLDSKKINVYLRGFPVQESSRVHTLHMPTIMVQLAVSFYKKPVNLKHYIDARLHFLSQFCLAVSPVRVNKQKAI